MPLGAQMQRAVLGSGREMDQAMDRPEESCWPGPGRRASGACGLEPALGTLGVVG